MFKVGDRVVRIRYPHGGVRVGSQGIVTGYDHALVYVKWDNGKLSNSDKANLVLQVEIVPEPSSAVSSWGSSPTTKPTNPKDRAATHRLDLSLFPETARIFGAVAMTEGDSKYGGYNYRVSGVNVSTYTAALARHMGKYFDRGEWADERTGVPHLANALACLAVLIDGHCKGNITDDRPPRIEADLYTWAEALSKSLHEMFPTGPARCTQTQLKDGDNACGVLDWLTQKS